MVPGTEILTFVTLIVNPKLLNDLTGYQPNYVDSSLYYYKDENDPNSFPRPVDFDPLFKSSTFFPKCCPPGSYYDVDGKDCKESPDIPSVYEDFKVKLNLVKSGLSECQVAVERFVKKQDLMQAPSRDLKARLKVGKVSYAPGKYCIDKTMQKDVYVVKVCTDREYCAGVFTTAKVREWCVNKCCWDGYSYKGGRCKFSGSYGLPNDKYRRYYESEDSYGTLYGLTHCSKQRFHKMDNLNFKIDTEGSLVLLDTNRKYKLEYYCLDSASLTDSELDVDDVVLLCENSKIVNIRLAITLVLVVMIFACYATAFLKSFLIYELQGLIVKLVACYTFVEAVFWIMIALSMFPAKFGDFCYVFGYSHVLLTIARLSWLNVLEYEIWRTMRNNEAYAFKPIATDICLRLICYSLYAITIPAVTMVVFIMSHRGLYPLPLSFIPRLNLFSCAVVLDNCGALHVIVPALILVTINLLLFGKILCCCPPDNKSDLYLISYPKGDHNQDTFVVNNKEVLLVLKLALVNILTYVYYTCAYSKLFNSEVTLDNVGGQIPPPYI